MLFFHPVNKYSLKIIDGLVRNVPLRRGAGGGDLYFNAILYGGSNPRSNPLPFYILFFCIKDTPFVFLLLKNGNPFTYYFGGVF